MAITKKKKATLAPNTFATIDDYHALFPIHIQKILQQLRSVIKQTAPQLSEVISYGMPAFKQNNVLVYYAAYKKHIGFYPTAAPIQVFRNELKKFKTSKGAIQFPINQALPLSLIKKIVTFRLKKDFEKAASKK
jgi:uncharacterized protein YdhG (YjbR/CyaY superfamily)